MKIFPPLCITSRLLPGVEIGEATISIEYVDGDSRYRQAYRWFIDFQEVDKRNAEGKDLESSVVDGTLQEGLESLLGFLGAFAEEWRYKLADGADDCIRDNCNLFPDGLVDWAVANTDEITMLQCELEEHPGEFIVE